MNKKSSILNNKFASIDLGSNNCRLLIVDLDNKKRDILRFSRVLNLAKNLTYNNEFTEETISSVTKHFKIIAKKMEEFHVSRYRCIATHACREAINASKLIDEIYKTTGINVEIISTEEEARLCLKSNMVFRKKNQIDFDLVLDIGGGSTELVLIKKLTNNYTIEDFEFISLPLGVINLSERVEVFGLEHVNSLLFKTISNFNDIKKKKFNVIGSCGTVTSICAIHNKLKYYDKSKVDGVIMAIEDIKRNCQIIKRMTKKEKIEHPCIGKRRHELLDNGIIILESILNIINIENILVSDRGLIEGMIEDYKVL